MGSTIEVVCEECKYRRVFNIGRNAKKESAYEVLKCYSKDLFTTIKQLDKAYNMTDYDYGESICVCKACNNLVNKTILTIKFQDSSDFIPKHFCNKCNSSLKIIEGPEELMEYNCPNCGDHSLRYINVCNWD